MLAKGNKAIVPTPLFRKKEQTARKGTTGVLNKSTRVEETKGLCWTALEAGAEAQVSESCVFCCFSRS